FEAFKAANDARLDELETRRSADGLLEEKVARIDQAVAAAQARLDRAMSEQRRPVLAAADPSTASRAPSPRGGEEKAWDGYLRSGQTPSGGFAATSPGGGGLEVKAGLSTAPGSGGSLAPPETERLVERRLMAASPMREI